MYYLNSNKGRYNSNLVELDLWVKEKNQLETCNFLPTEITFKYFFSFTNFLQHLSLFGQENVSPNHHTTSSEKLN